MLRTVASEGLHIVVAELSRLVSEKFHSLQDKCKHKVIWLFRELVKCSNMTGVDVLCWNLLRTIRQGDLSQGNRFLTEQVLDILAENPDWLYNHSNLVRAVIYTYVRILEDYNKYQLNDIRTKIAKYVVGLIRTRFEDAMSLGRDLVRGLMSVAKVPEISILWQELLHDPSSLHPDFTGLQMLMRKRTSTRYILLRILPEVERKIQFILNCVEFPNQGRYIEWFIRKYLITSESQTMRSDILR